MFSPDPGSDFFPSRICIKEIKYFNPKKWFLSSRKYDPVCSSRIPDQFLPIPDPGVKKVPDPGSATPRKSNGFQAANCQKNRNIPNLYYNTNRF
jgi:hypothetical protein